MLRLIDDKTGAELKAGDIVTTFRGERARLDALFPPAQTSGRSGHVRLAPENDDGTFAAPDEFSATYSASVINATFKP